MSALFRKSKVLEFEGGEKVTVRELEVSTLLLAQRGELELSDDVLIKECTGLNKIDLGLDAYNEIIAAIDALHADVFEKSEEGSEGDASSKKNSLN